VLGDERIGEVYLDADEIAARVAELGAELARDYDGLEPLLVGALKAGVVFAVDLSRQTAILHHLDFVEIAGYAGHDTGGHTQIRFLKDLDEEIEGRHVVLVEEVVDTGLTLNYLVRSFGLRNPASLKACALFDRPYRRLVDDLPLAYVGFTVPDEFFVGYGFDLEERYRNLPDVRVLRPAAATGAGNL
jgi:hypoxanthine phosphoribosyltransferase